MKTELSRDSLLNDLATAEDAGTSVCSDHTNGWPALSLCSVLLSTFSVYKTKHECNQL